MKKLSILIPTLSERHDKYQDRLQKELWRQVIELDKMSEVSVQVRYGDRSIGWERNWHIANADAEYVAFADDDDMITDCYIQKQLDVANSGADCGQLNGLYFENGIYDRPFIHSIATKEWYSTMEAHYRNTNHLNCTKTEIMRQIPFPEISFGEDHKQSEALMKSGLIKTEYPMRETIYLYYHISNK